VEVFVGWSISCDDWAAMPAVVRLDVEEVAMSASTTRMFTLSRVIALALITLLIAGLAYLRFAPDSSSISVQEGAKAGDLILEPCKYPTENGNYGAECGTLIVPEKRADPKSPLIAGRPWPYKHDLRQGEPIRGRA
jgi:hypothetical protein